MFLTGNTLQHCRRKLPVMTKLYAASDDEKSAEAADSDEDLLHADEVACSGRLCLPCARRSL